VHHDSLFRHVFANPANLAPWVRATLPRIAAEWDWGTLQECAGHFLGTGLRRHEADLLFVIAHRKVDAWVVLLIEHRSGPMRRVVLQVLRYVHQILNRWSARFADRRLHEVIGIVVHQGHAPARTANTLARLRGSLRIRGRRAQQLRCQIVRHAIRNHPRSALLHGPLPAAVRCAFLCMQLSPNMPPDELEAALLSWQDVLREATSAPRPAADIEVIQSYILKVTEMAPERLANLLARILGPEAERTLMSTYDRLLAEGEARGIAKGKALGIAKGEARGTSRGELRGRIEVLHRILRQRFGAEADRYRRKLERASVTTLDRWALRILDAKTIADVFAAK
jgi:Putative transposase, YhgA-like